jgi:predicted GH43/DUF377 family glycosyl hydrolase
LNGGEPILSPTSNWWETGVTFNAAALYLQPAPANQGILRALLPMRRPDDPELADGVVAIHYRARPENDPGSNFARSFIGLALFTPRLEPLYRYQEPVIFPDPDPLGWDALGVEDPRVTRLGDEFYMVYCGVASDPVATWRARLCLARSADLLHWQKLGPIQGEINDVNNKDGVLFPGPINERYYLLHRPFAGDRPITEMTIHLAYAASPTGAYQDCGEILRASLNPRMKASWVGAGSVPFSMVGGSRYAVIYHTGNYLNDADREYDLDAALFDFSCWDPARPASLVTARIEHLMVPQTPAELRSRSTLQVGNVLFACGSYEYEEDIYIIYGGADTYTLAARVNRQALFFALENGSLDNPFI